jgi:hypothetical protein
MGKITSYACPSMTGVRSSFTTNQPAVFLDNTAITGALLAFTSVYEQHSQSPQRCIHTQGSA